MSSFLYENCKYKLFNVTAKTEDFYYMFCLLFIMYILSTEATFFSIYFVHLSSFLQYIICPAKLFFAVYIWFTQVSFSIIYFIHLSHFLQYVFCPSKLPFRVNVLFRQANFCSIHFVHISSFLQYLFCPSKLLFMVHILLFIACILSTKDTFYCTYLVRCLGKDAWISLKIFKTLQHETISSNKKYFFISFHCNKRNYIFKSKFAVNSFASIALQLQHPLKYNVLGKKNLSENAFQENFVPYGKQYFEYNHYDLFLDDTDFY